MTKICLKGGEYVKIDKKYLSYVNKYVWYSSNDGNGYNKIINISNGRTLVLHRFIASKICDIRGKVVTLRNGNGFDLTSKNILIRNRGKQCQKYEMYDDRLFKYIDEPWKAYFLGWMYADGCMIKSMRCCRLALNSKDDSVLRFFTNKIFKSRKPLYNMKSHNEKLFTINNSVMCNDLVNLGLIPQKSLILNFPTKRQVSPKFLPFFIRGYFEGDGSVFLSKKKRSVVKTAGINICLTELFGRKLSSYLTNYGIISAIRQTTSIHLLSIKRYDSICKFYKLIYTPRPPFVLLRKYKKLKSIYDSRLLTNHKNSTSKFCGIFYNKTLKSRKWIASMTVKGKLYNLGRFGTENKALKAKIDFLDKMKLEC